MKEDKRCIVFTTGAIITFLVCYGQMRKMIPAGVFDRGTWPILSLVGLGFLGGYVSLVIADPRAAWDRFVGLPSKWSGFMRTSRERAEFFPRAFVYASLLSGSYGIMAYGFFGLMITPGHPDHLLKLGGIVTAVCFSYGIWASASVDTKDVLRGVRDRAMKWNSVALLLRGIRFVWSAIPKVADAILGDIMISCFVFGCAGAIAGLIMLNSVVIGIGVGSFLGFIISQSFAFSRNGISETGE